MHPPLSSEELFAVDCTSLGHARRHYHSDPGAPAPEPTPAKPAGVDGGPSACPRLAKQIANSLSGLGGRLSAPGSPPPLQAKCSKVAIWKLHHEHFCDSSGNVAGLQTEPRIMTLPFAEVDSIAVRAASKSICASSPRICSGGDSPFA